MADVNPLDVFFDAVFPPRCPLCGATSSGDGPCATHVLQLDSIPARCGRCAARLAPSLPDGFRCGGCARNAPRFRRTLTLGDYGQRSGLRDWILALKHGGRRDLAEPLGIALGELLAGVEEEWLSDACIVPVPLHAWRRVERGYDQAAALARAAALTAGAELVAALRRSTWTEPQGAAGTQTRAGNVRGVFTLRRRAGRRVRNRTVWLVDDVMTSGSTASECAAALVRAGARRVGVLVLARAARSGIIRVGG